MSGLFLTEEELKKLRENDPGVLAYLVEISSEYVMKLARWYAYNDIHLAEDIFQETFLEVIRCIHNLKDPNKLEWWLRKVTSNVAKGCIRERLRHRGHISIEHIDHEVGQATQHTEEILEYDKEIILHKFYEGLQELSDQELDVYTLRHVKNLTYKEIAAEIGKSTVQVGVVLGNARKKLKAFFSHHIKVFLLP